MSEDVCDWCLEVIESPGPFEAEDGDYICIDCYTTTMDHAEKLTEVQNE